MTLEGKTLVVAGGTGGIGGAIAALGVARRAHVVLIGRNGAKLRDAVVRIGTADGVVADLSSDDAARAAFDWIGSLDLLATPVGGAGASGPIAEVPAEDAEAALRAKFWTQVFIARAAAKRIAPGGSILLFGGVLSRRPQPGMAVMAAINGAIEAFSRALSLELAPVRVNALAPGLVDNEAYAGMPADAREAMFAAERKRLPARRVGANEDIAEAALAALTNPYVTGSVVDVDGGASIA